MHLSPPELLVRDGRQEGVGEEEAARIPALPE
jgi:hypothetical protein